MPEEIVAPQREALREFAPQLVKYTEEVIFGDLWEREELSRRDRSLVTITALVALGRAEQLPIHLKRGLNNGLTKEEIIEAITHLAFYSGWPTAMSAATIAKREFEQDS